jgi:hypothetical protein
MLNEEQNVPPQYCGVLQIMFNRIGAAQECDATNDAMKNYCL